MRKRISYVAAIVLVLAVGAAPATASNGISGTITATVDGVSADGATVAQGQSVQLVTSVTDIDNSGGDEIRLVIDGAGPDNIGPAGEEVCAALFGPDCAAVATDVTTPTTQTGGTFTPLDRDVTIAADAPPGAWTLNYYLVDADQQTVFATHSVGFTVEARPTGTIVSTVDGADASGAQVEQGATVRIVTRVENLTNTEGREIRLVVDGSGPGGIGPAGEEVCAALFGPDCAAVATDVTTPTTQTGGTFTPLDRDVTIAADAPPGAWTLNYYLVDADGDDPTFATASVGFVVVEPGQSTTTSRSSSEPDEAAGDTTQTEDGDDIVVSTDGVGHTIRHLKQTPIDPNNPPSPPPPGGLSFPYGLISFDIADVEPGACVEVTIQLPGPAQEYWKFQNGEWFQMEATFSGSSVTMTLCDGGVGDASGEANGYIVDPGAPAVRASFTG